MIKKHEEKSQQHFYGQKNSKNPNQSHNRYQSTSHNQRIHMFDHGYFMPHCFIASQKPQTTPSKQIQKKLNKKLGQMFNKKKGGTSILSSGHQKMMQLITNWCYDVDGEQIHFSPEEKKQHSDNWREFYQNKQDEQREQKDYYNDRRDQKRSHRQTIESLEGNTTVEDSLDTLISRTYPSPDDIQSLYYYDQCGPNQNFSLTHPLSNLIQSRLLFESWHYTNIGYSFSQINQAILQQQKKVEKLLEKEKKQSEQFEKDLKKANKFDQKKQIELFINQGLSKQILPQVINLHNVESEDSNSDDEKAAQYRTIESQHIDKNKINGNLRIISVNAKDQITNKKVPALQQKLQRQPAQKSKEKQNLKQKQASLASNITLSQQIPSNKLQPVQTNNKQPPINSKPTPIKPSPQTITYPPTLLSSLTQSYFTTIQTKYSRMAKQQKILKTFYFPSLESITWERVAECVDSVERIFIVIEEPNIVLIRMEKFYSMEKQLIKCIIYQFGTEIKEVDKELVRKEIKSSVFSYFIVTFSFKLIDIAKSLKQCNSEQVSNKKTIMTSQLPCKSLLSVHCLMGMLTVLIYEQKLQDSQYQTIDYLSKGEQLVKEYELFLLEDKQNQIQNYNEFIKFDTGYYQKLSKINYVFDLQSEEGVLFQKLSQTKNPGQQTEQLQVFKAKRKNRSDTLYQDEQQGSEEDEQQQSEGLQLFMKNDMKFNPQQEINQPSDKLSQQNHDTIEHRQAKIPEVTFSEQLLTSAHNYEGMKRSNSREQLKNINTFNLVFEVHNNINQTSKSQSVQDEQENQENQQFIKENQQNLAFNESEEFDDHQQEDDQQYVGL